MTITRKSIKLLWSNSAGRCSFYDCTERLSLPAQEDISPHTIGEMAHIRGNKPGALRYDPNQTQIERDDYTNLLLLCPTHHEIVDEPENVGLYPAEVLHDIKTEHEAFIASRLGVANVNDKTDVMRLVYPLHRENFESFSNFGPKSPIARKNPDSDAYQIWLSERLSTIVPNNRKIADLITVHIDFFVPEEQTVLQKFLLHVRTYERWVLDEVSYEGVVRFPPEFTTLIERLCDART